VTATDLAALAELATDVATQAGAMIRSRLIEPRLDVATKTTATDMVTEVDRASEDMIVAAIRAARPDDALMGEEGTDAGGTSGVVWLIDPIDGTTNYLYRYPAFCVSIAAAVDGKPAVGVVCDPAHDEVFVAVRGQGATLNGAALRLVETAKKLATALVGTGFAYEARRRAHQAVVMTHVLPAVRDMRRGGSAALDLCWVAAGRLDAFFERGLQPWDRAAGALIASEAGAWVGSLTRPPLDHDLTVACRREVAEPFIRLLDKSHALSDETTGWDGAPA
jgi:myo-inositol-1(or 4)-monophosphatase